MRPGDLFDVFDVFDFVPGTGGVIRPFIVGPVAAIAAWVNYDNARDGDVFTAVGSGSVAGSLAWTLFLSLVALVCLKKCIYIALWMRADTDKSWERAAPGWAKSTDWADFKRRLQRAMFGMLLVVVACVVGGEMWAARMPDFSGY